MSSQAPRRNDHVDAGQSVDARGAAPSPRRRQQIRGHSRGAVRDSAAFGRPRGGGAAPVTCGAVPEALAVLARRGSVTLAPARMAETTLYPELAPALRPGRVAELLDDERGQS